MIALWSSEGWKVIRNYTISNKLWQGKKEVRTDDQQRLPKQGPILALGDYLPKDNSRRTA